ncbi:MAG TPA: maleylpyruvate isomerase N-terminal domain-containing protein [Candidatus Limnocylindrales bacterium]
METESLKQGLAANYLRLRDLAGGGDLTARVPSCPEWTVADLVSHVAHVYLHKVEMMRHHGWPDPWPPAPTGETEVEMLERGYLALRAEFAARPATQEAVTWHDEDQTVGFWVRRMAHETVIHRIDAELGAGVASEPVPGDLALDGIDELLQLFLAWPSVKWGKFAGVAEGGAGGSVGVRAGGRRWWVWAGSPAAS